MRLLFSAGAGFSHIAPMLPLATTARDQGHDVLFVTGPGAERYPADAGLRTVAFGRPLAESIQPYFARYPRESLASLSRDERLAHLVAHYMVEISAAERLDDMLDLVRDWAPDLVITNLAEHAAMLAAVIAGVPHAMHAIGPPKSAAIMADARDAAARLAARYGVTDLPAREAVPYLDIWPDGLCPDGVDWEYPTRWPLRPEGAMPVPPADRPDVLDGLPFDRTVYVTPGTTHNGRPGTLEAMVDAVRAEPLNVVVTIGRNGDRDRFGEQPSHVRIEHFVPQEHLLPHVDLVVCHAGSGTVLGALAHGVPLVVSPIATDQFDMADQLLAAHAGLCAAPTPDAIRTAVHTINADPSYRTAATTIAHELHTMATPSTLLTHLEAHVAG